MTSLKLLPLQSFHLKAGARFGNFADWHMPITYPAGVMKEHLHVRSKVGLFDISHMQLLTVEGSAAAKFLSFALPVDAANFSQGRSYYSLILNDQAGILDDIIVTKLAEDRFMLVVNAANSKNDMAILQQRLLGFDCHITALERVLLALQGPLSAQIMQKLFPLCEQMRFMHGYEPEPDWFVTRSGYSGEDGFEIALPLHAAPSFVESLLSNPDIEWTGLAARDSLRLEAGLCLHGQDITAEINPVEAGLTFAVSKAARQNGAFIGAKAFLAACEHPPLKRRIGLSTTTRQPVRAGSELFDEQNHTIGIVTSGCFGPSYGAPIAMGYVASAFATPMTQIFTNIRDKIVPLNVHPLPFVPHNYFKG